MFEFLLNEEEKEIKRKIRDFIRNEVSSELLKEMDQDKVQYPQEFVQAIAQRNLLGLRFSPEYGGKGLGWTAEVAAIEEVGVLGAALGCLYSLPSIVGEALHLFGTNEQKKNYLEPVIKGKKFCSEALTEPRGGSDFFGATTTAIKDGDEYILKGQKRFIVGAEGADFFLLYAKTDTQTKDPHKSLSVFLVDRDSGVEVKKVYGLMGTRGGGTGRIILKNVRIPSKNLIGKEGDGGKIFNFMMVPERMTSAAGAIGSARAGLEVATKYSQKRHAFGREIRKYQGISFKVADSVAKLDAARGLLYIAAKSIDLGRDSRRLVSEAKKICTDTAWEVINHSMQIMGGIGYTSVYPVERLLRDIRLMMIWTGTNEIMNLLIQHEYFRELTQRKHPVRDIENDATDNDPEEKVFVDTDQVVSD